VTRVKFDESLRWLDAAWLAPLSAGRSAFARAALPSAAAGAGAAAGREPSAT